MEKFQPQPVGWCFQGVKNAQCSTLTALHCELARSWVICSRETDTIESSQSHRMVWAGKDLRHHLVPTPPSWAGALDHVVQSSIQRGLEHFQGCVPSTASLGNLFQCLTSLTVKHFFPISNYHQTSCISGWYCSSVNWHCCCQRKKKFLWEELFKPKANPQIYFHGVYQ